MTYVLGFPVFLWVWFSLAYAVCMLLLGGGAGSARNFDRSISFLFLAALVGLALLLRAVEGWSPSLSLNLPQTGNAPPSNLILLLLCLLAPIFGWAQYQLEHGLLQRFAPSSVASRPAAKAVSLLPALAIVPAAVLEELIWRGYLIPALVALWSLDVWLALLVSSLAFGIHHAHFGLRQIGIKAVHGALWGLLVLFSASLLPAMIAHIVFNLLVFYRRLPAAPILRPTSRKSVPVDRVRAGER